MRREHGHVAAQGAPAARRKLLRAYALYASGPGKRLFSADPSLDAKITRELISSGAGGPSLSQLIAQGVDPCA